MAVEDSPELRALLRAIKERLADGTASPAMLRALTTITRGWKDLQLPPGIEGKPIRQTHAARLVGVSEATIRYAVERDDIILLARARRAVWLDRDSVLEWSRRRAQRIEVSTPPTAVIDVRNGEASHLLTIAEAAQTITLADGTHPTEAQVRRWIDGRTLDKRHHPQGTMTTLESVKRLQERIDRKPAKK